MENCELRMMKANDPTVLFLISNFQFLILNSQFTILNSLRCPFTFPTGAEVGE